MTRILAMILSLAATPSIADITRALDQYILPGYSNFADTTAALRDTALADCSIDIVRPAWNEAFDAWLQINHLHFGPAEKDGRAVIIAFWPDTRGSGPRTLATLISEQDRIIETAEGTATLSAAARGFNALEYLLYDQQFAETDAYGCALIRAITSDLARISNDISTEWNDEYGEILRTAGEQGNSIYLTELEGVQALFTSLMAGLEFNADMRLGRPLGTFDRPRPKRAENWRSDRSQRNLLLSLQGLRELKNAISDSETPVTDAAFDRTFSLLHQYDDAGFTNVSDPQNRLKLEIIQQSVHAIRDAAEVEFSSLFGIEAGFNSTDGD